MSKERLSGTDNLPSEIPSAPLVNQAEYNIWNTNDRFKETEFGSNWQKWGNARRVLAKSAMIAGTSAAVLVGLYSKDVAAVQEQFKDAKPVIRVTGTPENPADSHRMIIGINGLGTTSARNSMEALPYESLGLETALEYDKRGIDTTVIKETVKEYALEHGIDQIVFSGHSMGGDVALEVASLLHIDPEAPEVSDIILDCTPPNLSAVHEDRRRAGDAMLSAIGDIPGHRSSRIFRGTGEMISRHKQYIDSDGSIVSPMSLIDISDFMEEAKKVRTTKLSPTSGTLGLLTDQYRQIAADGVDESFERLAKMMADKRIPRVSFLLPLDASKDTVVRVEKARDILLELGKEYNIIVNIYRLPAGTGHANPAQRPEQYSFTVNKYILPTIREAYDDYAEYKRTGDKLLEKDVADTRETQYK